MSRNITNISSHCLSVRRNHKLRKICSSIWLTALDSTWKGWRESWTRVLPMWKLYHVRQTCCHLTVLLTVLIFIAEDCRIALASCQPTPSLQNQLPTIVKKITEAQNVLNKAVLFIKPSDLVDGITNLSIGTQKKYRGEDIVTKGVVMTQEPHLTCSRCGGSSNVVFDSQSHEYVSDRWRIWEKMWTLRCICGGSWVGGN